MNISHRIAHAAKNFDEMKPRIESPIRDAVAWLRQIDFEAIQKAITEVQKLADAAPQLKKAYTDANITLATSGWHIGGVIPAESGSAGCGHYRGQCRRHRHPVLPTPHPTGSYVRHSIS